MSLRSCCLLLLAVLAAGQAGCCASHQCQLDWGPAGSLHQRTWRCSQCGPVFWHEWFSFPPMCRDSCNRCGDFTASNNPYVLSGPSEARFGPIYDDGSGRGAARGQSAQPTVAPGPTPAEELPPGEPTTSLGDDQFGRMVSHELRPIDPRRRQSARGMRPDYEPGDEWPIDSPRPSRKLGRPSRPARYVR